MSSPARPKSPRKSSGRRSRGPAKSKNPSKARAEAGPPRLQKLLAQAGVASRRAAETLISAGRVRVDGRPVTELGTRVDPKLATIEVDGVVIAAQEPTYIVMNKPDEVVSSAEASKDPQGRSTVVSLLGGLRTRVVPLGRLDYHTRGVLLLTNDGALHAALLHPRRAVPKTYHAKFQGKLGEDQLAQLHAGVQLEDGTRTRPSLEVEIVRATTTNTWVQLTISQGLNRQIRRMGDAIGHSVLKLIRVAFAGITADGLREGQWRHLRPEEVSGLYTVAGLKAPARDQAALPAVTPRGVAVMRSKRGDRPDEVAGAEAPATSRRGRGARPGSTRAPESEPEAEAERTPSRRGSAPAGRAAVPPGARPKAAGRRDDGRSEAKRTGKPGPKATGARSRGASGTRPPGKSAARPAAKSGARPKSAGAGGARKSGASRLASRKR